MKADFEIPACGSSIVACKYVYQPVVVLSVGSLLVCPGDQLLVVL